MPGPNVEGFSLSHASILDGFTGAETQPIYGIREGSIAVDTSDYDNTGDDSILSTWTWFNFATLTVQAGYVPFDIIALLAGSTITSSGVGAASHFSLPLWNESSLNQPSRPVLIRVPSKDTAGAAKFLDFILYKVTFHPITFDGPSYKNGLLLNYSGKALMSATDEKGAALTERSIGRLVSRPRVTGAGYIEAV